MAQLGATLGREFSYELLRAVTPTSETDSQAALAKLVEAEILYQRGVGQQTRYFFKHALIQDTAYQSLLKSTRHQYHQQIARVLEERFPDTKKHQPELLAHHYTEAGLIEQAISYWQQGGQQAVQRSANTEAVNHLTTALELLKTLPDTPKRVQQELTLQLTLGAPLMATNGYAVPEVERCYARARELCQRLGETPQVFPALWGLWVFYILRAEYKTARELGEQLLRLAQNVQDPTFFVQAHFALGETLLVLGEFVSARVHLEQSNAFYNPQQHRSLAFLAGFDPGIISLSWAAWALWMLGYPDQALRSNSEALALAQGLSHPPSLAFALTHAAWLHQFRREGRAAQERAEAVIALCAEQGIPFFLANGTIGRGWALAEHGQVEEGIAQIRQGMTAWREMGAESSWSQWLTLLAEAYRKGGQTEEGLAALTEALAAVSKLGEHHYEAELYRLYGELSLRMGETESGRNGEQEGSFSFADSPFRRFPVSSSEEAFLKAIEIARKQQAKSWELRASTSLARLWQSQGKHHEARNILSEIYSWFTEGFDTKDLQEAKALIEELGQ